jgi:hypothetical protein
MSDIASCTFEGFDPDYFLQDWADTTQLVSDYNTFVQPYLDEYLETYELSAAFTDNTGQVYVDEDVSFKEFKDRLNNFYQWNSGVASFLNEEKIDSGLVGYNYQQETVTIEHPQLLELDNFSKSDSIYIKRYGAPNDPAIFHQLVSQAYQEHLSYVSYGALDMISDYVLVTQCSDISTVCKPDPVKFLEILRNDPDHERQAIIYDWLDFAKEQTGLTREEDIALSLMINAYETQQQFVVGENYTEILDNRYLLAERGLRSTSEYWHLIGPSYFLSEPAYREFLPVTVNKVLIIGPGLEFINTEIGTDVSQQMYEPFAIMDSLIKSGLADPSVLEMDLMDINPHVTRHIKKAKEAANQGESYPLTITLSDYRDNQAPEVSEIFNSFGSHLPHQEEEPIQDSSEEVAIRTLSIDPAVLDRMHPIEADATMHHYGNGDYDLIICFNTMVYWNEPERVFAGISVKNALREGGVFLTDNTFTTDTGDRKTVRGTKPSLDLFAPDFPLQKNFEENITIGEDTTKEIVVYRKEKSIE